MLPLLYIDFIQYMLYYINIKYWRIYIKILKHFKPMWSTHNYISGR